MYDELYSPLIIIVRSIIAKYSIIAKLGAWSVLYFIKKINYSIHILDCREFDTRKFSLTANDNLGKVKQFS